jgi:hypothetical protein
MQPSHQTHHPGNSPRQNAHCMRAASATALAPFARTAITPGVTARPSPIDNCITVTEVMSVCLFCTAVCSCPTVSMRMLQHAIGSAAQAEMSGEGRRGRRRGDSWCSHAVCTWSEASAIQGGLSAALSPLPGLPPGSLTTPLEPLMPAGCPTRVRHVYVACA